MQLELQVTEARRAAQESAARCEAADQLKREAFSALRAERARADEELYDTQVQGLARKRLHDLTMQAATAHTRRAQLAPIHSAVMHEQLLCCHAYKR